MRRLLRSPLAIPIAAYVAITLLVPLVRGAWVRPAFWHHAAVVVAVCAAIAAALALVGRRRARRRSGDPIC